MTIIDELKTVIHEDAVEEWLDTPNPAFDLKCPRDMIETEDEYHLRDMIYRQGMPT